MLSYETHRVHRKLRTREFLPTPLPRAAISLAVGLHGCRNTPLVLLNNEKGSHCVDIRTPPSAQPLVTALPSAEGTPPWLGGRKHRSVAGPPQMPLSLTEFVPLLSPAPHFLSFEHSLGSHSGCGFWKSCGENVLL